MEWLMNSYSKLGRAANADSVFIRVRTCPIKKNKKNNWSNQKLESKSSFKTSFFLK